MMEPQIRFCSRSDGVRIAYATLGDGPPLVRPPGWISHLEQEWKNPSVRAFYQPLARHHMCVTYDKHGTGLSDRDRDELTLAAELNDLETVLDHLELERVALLGVSQAGPVCAAYAANHPDRVSHLILYGAYARGPKIASDDLQKSMTSLIRAHWGVGSKALADVFMPGADAEEAENFAKLQQAAATSEMAARLLDLCYQIDVSDELANISAPTLFMHRDRDRAMSSSLGRELATMIPGARFMPLEGRMHPPQLGDSAPILEAIGEFLGDPVTKEPSVSRGIAPGGLATILFTDIESSTALTQRLGDAKAQELVRAHNAIVREALKTHRGSEIKHTGDGIMASFPSASGALECAVAIQQGVAARTEEQPEVPLGVRIGLNAGEPVAEERDLFGTAVQLASRICDRAGGGEILASDVVRQLAAGKGFLFADNGETELRGFEDPVRLYEVRWREG
jgi:class 3 adenylate cyclase